MAYLVNRRYELSLLKTQIRPASDISRNDALKPKPKQQTDTVPFVITYNPALPHIFRVIDPSPKCLPKIQISQN